MNRRSIYVVIGQYPHKIAGCDVRRSYAVEDLGDA
jgi:hypothetical protein